MTGATADRLKTVESKIDHQRDVLAQIKSAPQDFKDPHGLMIGTFDKLEGLQREQTELLSELGKSNGDGGGRAWGVEGLNDPRIKAILEGVSASNAPFGRLPIGEAIDGRVLAGQLGRVAKADVAVGTAARRGDFAGVAEQPRRQLSLLDLVSTAPTDGASVPYLVESGSFDTALETAEGAAKPEGSAAYTDASADVATVAHWLKLRKQSLADVEGLQAAIDGRLRYGVLRRLENEILAGDGAAPNIRGILNTSGIQTQAYVAGPVVDQLVRGVSDSDQDDFIKNRVTLLGEMRAALAVWAPSLFVDVDLAA